MNKSQQQIYEIRKSIKDSFGDITEERLYNYTIELYSLNNYKFPFKNRTPMRQQDYILVKALQEKEGRVEKQNHRNDLVARMRRAGL